MQFLQLCNAGEDSKPECQLFSFTRTKVVYVQFDVLEKQMRIPFSVCDLIFIFFSNLVCFLSPSPFSSVSFFHRAIQCSLFWSCFCARILYNFFIASFFSCCLLYLLCVCVCVCISCHDSCAGLSCFFRIQSEKIKKSQQSTMSHIFFSLFFFF